MGRSFRGRLFTFWGDAQQARDAIENVCAGNLDRLSEFYDPRFHDHVNTMQIAVSVGRKLQPFAALQFPGLEFEFARWRSPPIRCASTGCRTRR